MLARMYCLCLCLMQLNKDTNDLLWLAIVGLTDQYIHQVCGHYLRTRSQWYTKLLVFHRQFLARGYYRLCPRDENAAVQQIPIAGIGR